VVFFAPLRFVLRSLGVGLRLVSVVKAVTTLFLFIFFIGFFKASSKTRNNFFSKKIIWAITCGFFFVRFFFFPLPRLFDSIFLSRFWAFRHKGGKKNAIKKSHENLLSSQKK
jgi:hypothetical protein